MAEHVNETKTTEGPPNLWKNPDCSQAGGSIWDLGVRSCLLLAVIEVYLVSIDLPAFRNLLRFIANQLSHQGINRVNLSSLEWRSVNDSRVTKNIGIELPRTIWNRILTGEGRGSTSIKQNPWRGKFKYRNHLMQLKCDA